LHEQGYSWAELKRLKKAPKTIPGAPAALKLTKAMPVLYVSDVAAANFYRDKLGFTIDSPRPPAFYASVSRDEACIHCDSYISRCTLQIF
jgi:hypothetical protein